MTRQPVTLRATVQDHRAVREAWAVATVLIHDLDGTADPGAVPSSVRPGAEIPAVGNRMGLTQVGQRLRLSGSFEQTKFGLQLRVEQQISEGVVSTRDASRWLQRLDGVGPKLARVLHDRYGDQLVAILAGEIEADLTEVHGISARVAEHIHESYAELELSGDLETVRYLEEIGASRYESSKILEYCKKQRTKPKELLETEPYELTKVRGLGFVRVDRLARKAGCAPDAPARIEAAVMHQLGEIVQHGSTMVPLSGTRTGGLSGEATDLLCMSDRDLVFSAVHRLAAKGELVLAESDPDENGKSKTWVHPAWLLSAERRIYRAAKGKVRREVPSIRSGVPSGGQAGEAAEAVSPTPLAGDSGSIPTAVVPASPAPVVIPRGFAVPGVDPQLGETVGLEARLRDALDVTARMQQLADEAAVLSAPAGTVARAARVEALLGMVGDGSTQEDW